MKLTITSANRRTVVATTSVAKIGHSASKSFRAAIAELPAEVQAAAIAAVETGYGVALSSVEINGYEIEQDGKTIKIYRLSPILASHETEVEDAAAARVYLKALPDSNGEGATMTQAKAGTGIIASFNHRFYTATLA